MARLIAVNKLFCPAKSIFELPQTLSEKSKNSENPKYFARFFVQFHFHGVTSRQLNYICVCQGFQVKVVFAFEQK